MYAIIETGGKQYRVSEGDKLKIEKIETKDTNIKIDKVLLIKKDGELIIGNPYIENAKIIAKVIETAKDKKVLIFKKKPRKGHKKLRGHRQYYRKIKIESINGG